MEPVTNWSTETVRGYLEGLDSCLQQYTFQEWDISGQDLLDLSPQRLGLLGVRSIGHQEIILEAVEQLCALHYDLQSENLRSLTEKLWGVSQNLRSHILSHRKMLSLSPTTVLSPTPKQLACIIDIVSAARSLFSWLNRYLFTRLNDYSASRDVIALCVELAETLHKDWSDPQIEERILSVCQNICGICENILSCSPHRLLSQTAILEPVQIHPEPPHYSLSPAGRCSGIFAGDEIIQVNDQVVVGWTRTNLVKKLLENTHCVTLILKKVSIPSTSFGTSSFHKLHRSPSSLSTQSAPSTQTEKQEPYSQTGQSASTLKIQTSVPISQVTHSAPTTPTGPTEAGLLHGHSAPTTPSGNILHNFTTESRAPTSPVFSDTQESSTKSSIYNNQSGPTESLFQTAGFWTYPGSSSYYKSHVASIFPSSPPSPSYPEFDSPKDKTTPPNFSTFLETLASDSQSQSPLTSTSQDKRISRPRTGSDSVSTPTASILPLPLSPVNLRPSLSDSNLHSSANPHQHKLIGVDGSPDSLVLAQKKQTSKSTQAENKLKSPDSRNLKQREKAGTTRTQKGVVTKLSRRRVSCKDLGSPDCDGWLWKRKENVGFMSQRWKRCWCVLKGDRMFWYNGPQDEKALGMLNVSSYKLESTMEPKKKYEFQLGHKTYKPFVFAADSLSDMSRWVTNLISSPNKHKASHSAANPREEECYSETEDEDQSKMQKMGEKQMIKSPTKAMLETETISLQADQGAKGVGPTSGSSNSKPEDEGLESLIHCLKQGGVSLIGTKTLLTRDEYRKSFARRNKNPDINRKAHSLRALQSTLKAKLLELDALNQVLENTNLTSAVFQKWKSDHGQIYESLGKESKGRGYGRELSPKQERKPNMSESELDKERREESETSDD
ncbi:connector enhancer of kinase suppressor of ras 1 isoform 2-T2 [Discoglossus pictus]